VAIDCGCGAGSDIAFLRTEGFRVYAFDIEQEAIDYCQKRFDQDADVTLSLASFDTYDYPSASLISADSSLFYCSEDIFESVWSKIIGSFLGAEDTTAGPNYKKSVYWPDVMVATEEQIRHWMKDYRIVSLTEHKSSGKATDGELHQWHIFSVVAQK